MEKEFIPYEQALALKELGFDEECFSFYNTTETLISSEFLWKNSYSNGVDIVAPLYQQAFSFFREKYGLYYTISPEFYTKGINFNYQILWYLPENEWTEYIISSGTYWYGDNGEYQTQEEAELECLKKLIEIVNKK